MSALEQLEKLAKLFEQGLLTEDEFAQAKSTLISEQSSTESSKEKQASISPASDNVTEDNASGGPLDSTHIDSGIESFPASQAGKDAASRIHDFEVIEEVKPVSLDSSDSKYQSDIKEESEKIDNQLQSYSDKTERKKSPKPNISIPLALTAASLGVFLSLPTILFQCSISGRDRQETPGYRN